MSIRLQLFTGFSILIMVFFVDFMVNKRLSNVIFKNTAYLTNSESVIRNSNMLQKEMIEMQSGFRKLLSEDLLKEYGFIENPFNPSPFINKVMTRDNIDIAIKDDGIYCINMDIYYPLKDIAGLRKLYKELRSQDLKPV